MADQKKQLPPRADKAAFRAFMGAFLLIACIPAAVWSYWSYSSYRQTLSHTRTILEQPDLTETSTERAQTLTLRSSMADRYRLEAVLSGAGSLVLFGGSMLLFVSAAKSRKNKPEYANVDRATITLPQQPIKVVYRRLQGILGGFVIIFFALLVMLVLRAGGLKTASVTISALIVVFLLSFSYLMIRAKRRGVSMFDDYGITRGDGRQFRWSEFRGLITEIDLTRVAKRIYLWRIKLAFENGEEAWIIPSRVKNEEEVFGYLGTLPRAYVKNHE